MISLPHRPQKVTTHFFRHHEVSTVLAEIKDPFTNELTNLYHIPLEAVQGSRETMCPVYGKKLKEKVVRPGKSVRNCGGTRS